MKKASKRKTFHHGDLRRSILDGTLRLIGSRGVRGFSLSDASREAGVSRSAPYRHFASKEAILVELATECFGRFEAELAAAGEGVGAGAVGGTGGAEESLREMLRIYFRTALHRPAEFQAMFASGIDKGDFRELAVLAERCFDRLRGCVARCLEGDAAGERSLGVTYQLWIAVHGLSMLSMDGSLRKLGGEKRVLVLIDELLATHGLGVGKGLGDG